MAVFPAGKLSDLSPLTSTEAAVLIAVDQWAEENTSWYKKNKFLNLMIILSSVSAFGVLIHWIIGVISFLFLIISWFIKIQSKPVPVKVNQIAATSHSIAFWNKNPHLVSKNPQYATLLEIRQGIEDRTGHNPENFPAANQWRQGEDGYYQLSLDSLIQLNDDEIQFVNSVRTAPIHSISLNILTGHNAKINEQMYGEFSNSHIGEDVAQIAFSIDEEEFSEVSNLYSWMNESFSHNKKVIDEAIQGMNENREIYEEWADHLREKGEFLNFITFDSTNQGWKKALKGLKKGEESLEKSVASEIIAQEQSVRREMEQAEAKMREKSADFRLSIAEEAERLGRRKEELRGMMAAQRSTLSKLQHVSVNTSDKITLQSVYGRTTGGGGFVGQQGGNISGVSTSVETHYYDIENPAISTINGIIELASGELTRYQKMDETLESEIEGLSGAFERRSAQMKKQQQERLDELETAKERAVHAIRKDSREVRSIENQTVESQNRPWKKLEERSLITWNRPFSIVNEQIIIHNKFTQETNRLKIDIENEITGIEQYMQTPTINTRIDTNKVTHHWVVINGKPFSEILSQKPVEFNSHSDIQVEEGETGFILGVKQSDIKGYNLDPNQINSAIITLSRRGAIENEVFKILSKIKTPQIVNAKNASKGASTS
jgi:hypothetical protein